GRRAEALPRGAIPAAHVHAAQGIDVARLAPAEHGRAVARDDHVGPVEAVDEALHRPAAIVADAAGAAETGARGRRRHCRAHRHPRAAGPRHRIDVVVDAVEPRWIAVLEIV